MSEFLFYYLALICAGIVVFKCARRIASFETYLAGRWPTPPTSWIAKRFPEAHWKAVGVAWVFLGALFIVIKLLPH